ncbi:MAG: V-type ATP synthase subunit E [Candidatus Makaraimicrobium thalassicum]|nr:MAG: V-type ATP synthase subunit E [Candidatus Omnitrophota bacterium]
MEMDLKNIIEKIKEEGVGEAEKRAADIISQAEERAKSIIEMAEREKEEIIRKAGEEDKRLRKNGEEAIKQAARDVILGLRGDIIALFDRIVKKEVTEQLSPKVLKDMIARLVENFNKDGDVELEVLLSKKDRTALEHILFAGLKSKMAKGVTLKASPNVEKGFRVGEKGKHSYYDFTDEAIAEAFKSFLGPKITEILEG